MTKTHKKLWIGLIVMALISPIGIILPEFLNSGDAWGEWGADTLETLIGFVPEGLRKYLDVWSAPVADYNFGGEESSMTVKAISYIISGIIGILIVAAVIYIITKVVIRDDR